MDTQAISFKALTQKYTIKIPRIQRDYAQGRENAQKIREKFVKDLFESLKNDKTLHLQFVYGSVKNGNDFIPLDGQQRLTTLYLLHWYIAMQNNTTESYLANFTYETRSSSREFCKALSENTQKFYQAMQEALAQIQEKKKSKSNETILSTTIKDQAWFLPFWEQDPTIQSMLTMLDSIHTEASKYSLDTLTLERLDRLTFSLIELRDFGLDDELYIKMNARGAPLSEWENFKAAFEGFLGEKFKDDETIAEVIAKNLDNKWLKTLFNYVKYQGEEKQMERIETAQSYMLNIIKYLCEMLYYRANENEKSSFDWDKVHFGHFDEKLESSSPTKKGSATTQNAHSMYKIFDKEALEILIYVFDNFRAIQSETAEVFRSFTETIGESVGDKVCIFDKKDTKNSNEITSGKELFAAMVQDTRLSNKEQTRKLSRKDALYLFALISLMKKQDENKTNKLREVRNYCEKQRDLSSGALFYKSTIQDDMGKHIAECVNICDDNNIVIKNKLVKEFEDHQYFKGDLKLLLDENKAKGKEPLDENMLKKAQNILNTTPTHRIITNLIYHRFNRNFWLGGTYGKGKFLFGGTEAWHIMLTQNWKNKIDGELATAFKTMFKDGLKSSDELCKKFAPHQWQYYFIKYSESFFKENHNVFTWLCDCDDTLEIYRLVNYKSAEGKASGGNPQKGTHNPFLEVVETRLKKEGFEAHYETGENIQSKGHFVAIKDQCEIRCENASFVLTPLSDECKKALEKSSLKPSNKNFTISLTDHKDIIETLIDLFKSSNNPS